MSQMTPEDYNALVDLLDGRIDELTKAIPSRQILRFAEALRSAYSGDQDSPDTYGEDDYENLMTAQSIVSEFLPSILKRIRANSIDQVSGWRFLAVDAGNGDSGLCAICRNPYQHFEQTVKVHCLDMHPDAYSGVCRECVRENAPLEFVESEAVGEWLNTGKVTVAVEKDKKREGQRLALIDAIRRHAHSTHYFGEIVGMAPKWAPGAFGEWR